MDKEKNGRETVTEKISVIIPIYNVEKYLRRCINAVREQSYTDLEIILVDDGSTDESAAICDEMAGEDERIRVIHKKNGGSSSARNCGIEAAEGAYIGFLDSDDWPQKDMYETLHRALKEYPKAGIAQVMSRDFDEQKNLVKGPQRDDQKTVLLQKEEYFSELMLHVGDSSFCTKLFRAPVIKKYRFKEKELNEDFELLLRMFPEFESIVTVGKVGYNIELRGGSNTRGKYEQARFEAMMRNADTAMRMAKEEFPSQEVKARRFVLVQALDFFLHVPVEEMRKDNPFYLQMEERLKSSKEEIDTNPFLSARDRKNLKILYPAPRTVRRLHGVWMRIKGNGK
mgnify:CR=1 FL=1